MSKPKLPALTRRERQIMDVLYKAEQATAAEILEGLADRPNYSTVRAQLRVLEEKGHVRHEELGLRYVYSPTLPRDTAGVSALRHLLETFFEGSAEQVVTALVDGEVSKLNAEELDRLSQILEKARFDRAKEGRR